MTEEEITIGYVVEDLTTTKTVWNESAIRSISLFVEPVDITKYTVIVAVKLD